MKKIKILSLFVCLIALLAACEDEDITPSYGARTVLVYIAGNNSLGQSDFDSKDVSEMIEGMKGTEGTTNNLLVYFAGYKKTAKLIRLIKNGKGEVKQETVMSYDKHNSVNLDVMKDVQPGLDTDEGRRLTLVEECHDRWVENARTLRSGNSRNSRKEVRP